MGDLLLSRWDGEETPFWSDAPDHNATTIKKNMKRMLRRQWDSWFEDDGGADMNAGKAEEEGLFQELLGGDDKNDGDLGGGGGIGESSGSPSAEAAAKPTAKGLNLGYKARASAKKATESPSSRAAKEKVATVERLGRKAAEAAPSAEQVVKWAAIAKPPSLSRSLLKAAAAPAAVSAAKTAKVAKAEPPKVSSPAAPSAKAATPVPKEPAASAPSAKAATPREAAATASASAPKSAKLRAPSPLRSLRGIHAQLSPPLRGVPTYRPSDAKPLIAQADSRHKGSVSPGTLPVAEEEEFAEAFENALSRSAARSSNKPLFTTPVRHAVGKAIGAAIAYGAAQIIRATMPAESDGVEKALQAAVERRSAKKSPAAAVATAAAATAAPAPTPKIAVENLKWPGLQREAMRRGITQEQIAEITAAPYAGASHFTPQKTKQLRAYLLAH